MFARVAFLVLLLAGPALGAESPAVQSARVTATLVTDTDAVAPGQPFQAGLRLRIAPGWHVYWRNPGEAGQATDFTPDLPPGAAAGPLGWPAPQRFSESGISVYGYTGEVVLPLTVTPGAAAGDALHLAASASWLVCQSICVPEQGGFALDLPWGSATSSAQAPLLQQARARVPGPAPFDAGVSPSGVLTLSGAGLASVRMAQFFPDTPDAVVDGADQPVAVADGRVTLRLSPGPQFQPGALTGAVAVV